MVFAFNVGKILDDAKQVSEYKIESKNFVVIMVSKVSSFICCATFHNLVTLYSPV